MDGARRVPNLSGVDAGVSERELREGVRRTAGDLVALSAVEPLRDGVRCPAGDLVGLSVSDRLRDGVLEPLALLGLDIFLKIKIVHCFYKFGANYFYFSLKSEKIIQMLHNLSKPTNKM